MDPFSLVYGRQARLPVELDLPVTDSSSANIEDEDLALKRRAKAFLTVSEQRKIAKKRIYDAQKSKRSTMTGVSVMKDLRKGKMFFFTIQGKSAERVGNLKRNG